MTGSATVTDDPARDQRRFDDLAVDTVRFLAVDAVQAAASGHPGLPLGAAPAAWVLWSRHLRHDPADPGWPDRDRFVLSAGHGSALLYALLHVTGYDLPIEELRRFRRLGSRTPGHPEYGLTPGVETTTGPLGQGLANAVGMALAERMLAARCNVGGHRVVDHRTWALVGDGCLMEGISHEAASLAGRLGLGKLTVVFDDNDITIDGTATRSCADDVAARFRAYGWRTLRVDDGTDLDAIDLAIAEAVADDERPTLVAVRTTIGPEGAVDVVLAACGSEVALALEAADLLTGRGLGARVVSVMWRERFEEAVRAGAVRLPDVPVVWIEAGVSTGWRAVAGPRDRVVGIDRFGESGPGRDVAAHLGLTPGAVADAAFWVLGRDAAGPEGA